MIYIERLYLYILTEKKQLVFSFFPSVSKRPVEYYYAKPTRAVSYFR